MSEYANFRAMLERAEVPFTVIETSLMIVRVGDVLWHFDKDGNLIAQGTYE